MGPWRRCKETTAVSLVRRSDNGAWTFPAGYSDLGENVAHTAVRETWKKLATTSPSSASWPSIPRQPTTTPFPMAIRLKMWARCFWRGSLAGSLPQTRPKFQPSPGCCRKRSSSRCQKFFATCMNVYWPWGQKVCCWIEGQHRSQNSLAGGHGSRIVGSGNSRLCVDRRVGGSRFPVYDGDYADDCGLRRG
ncbi:MAG: NUDIX domain-containing protein [Chloroflexi bacterium]|nr:NUDIX domain-containing protein [Chloroflexota bacterium]